MKEKKSKFAKRIVYVFFTLVFIMVISGACSGKAVGINNYPMNYSIAYFNNLGYLNAPTVGDLFGSNVQFATSFNNIPTEITLESTSVNKDEFSATILMTLILTETNEKRDAFRMQVRFNADSFAEKSYVKYIKVVSLISGQTTELLSDGSEMENAHILGFFVEMMGLFWDTSKFK
ncbi:MAG: hypothetical protein FWD47_07335 [Treponema sp.]|nr:hypothetical protein [Treponema sp.]